MDSMRQIYISSHIESVDSLNALNDQIIKYFKETHDNISDIIRRKITDLETSIEDISRKLNALRSLIVTGVNQIIKPEDVQKKMCPVCFDNEVNTALVPCGHTYCKGCSEQDRSRYAKCPQCRTQINARIKIFFSV
jgi:esterase/lipase